jgi:DNA mismatch repair protein MutL
VYAFIHAAVKHALAQFSITPTLDFELDASIQSLEAIQKPFTDEKQAAAQSGSIFRTFTEAHQAHRISSDPLPAQQPTQSPQLRYQPENELQSFRFDEQPQLVQLFNTYILAPAERQFLLVHQQSAHERIIYERLINAMQGRQVPTQRSLFPLTLDPAPADAAIVRELIPDLHLIGYEIEPFGNNSFVIQGTPADIEAGNEKQIVERILEQYKFFSSELKLPRREMLIRSVASQQSIKSGTTLSQKEMQQLLSDLFQCNQPNSTPTGRPTFLEFKREQLEKMFGRF